MSGIAGIVSFDGRPIDREAFARMMQALSPRGPDGQHSVIGEDFALGNAIFHTTPESSLEQQPLRFEHFIVTADARIDNRAELLDELDIPKPEQSKLSDAGVIVRAYAKWKRAAPYKLEGNFAFAIWDLHEKRLFCARDVFGARPFCFTKLPWGFVFASDTMAMRASKLFDLTINEGRFADALTPIYMESLHVHETLWNEIERLRHQHWLEAHNNQLTKQVYFRFAETHVDLPKSDEDKIALFHDEFVRSVDRCLRSVGPVGLTLTGGLDSGSIACVARRLLKERGQGPLRAYSALLGGPECTETPGVNAIMEGGHIDLNVIGPNDAEEMASDYLRLFRETDHAPFDVFASPVMLSPYTRAAAAGTRIVMDGRDGGMIAGGPHNAMFLALRERDPGALWALMTTRGGAQPPSRPRIALRRLTRAMSHWIQYDWLRPMSPRAYASLRIARARDAAQVWRESRLFAPRLLTSTGFVERLQPLASTHGTLHGSSVETLAWPFDAMGYAALSLERSDRSGAFAGVESRQPLFDRRLVTLAMHLPWRLTRDERGTKPLMRAAFRQLPQRTLLAPPAGGVHWPLRSQLLATKEAQRWLNERLAWAKGMPEWVDAKLVDRARSSLASGGMSVPEARSALRIASAADWLAGWGRVR